MGRLRATELQEHFSNDYTEQDRERDMELDDLLYEHSYYLNLQDEDSLMSDVHSVDMDDWFPDPWMDHGQL